MPRNFSMFPCPHIPNNLFHASRMSCFPVYIFCSICHWIVVPQYNGFNSSHSLPQIHITYSPDDPFLESERIERFLLHDPIFPFLRHRRFTRRHGNHHRRIINRRRNNAVLPSSTARAILRRLFQLANERRRRRAMDLNQPPVDTPNVNPPVNGLNPRGVGAGTSTAPPPFRPLGGNNMHGAYQHQHAPPMFHFPSANTMHGGAYQHAPPSMVPFGGGVLAAQGELSSQFAARRVGLESSNEGENAATRPYLDQMDQPLPVDIDLNERVEGNDQDIDLNLGF